jgi:DNA-directed RNA polymerase subunit RPC12/RpoP
MARIESIPTKCFICGAKYKSHEYYPDKCPFCGFVMPGWRRGLKSKSTDNSEGILDVEVCSA